MEKPKYVTILSRKPPTHLFGIIIKYNRYGMVKNEIVPKSKNRPVTKIRAILTKLRSTSPKFQKRKINLTIKERHTKQKTKTFNNLNLFAKKPHHIIILYLSKFMQRI